MVREIRHRTTICQVSLLATLISMIVMRRVFRVTGIYISGNMCFSYIRVIWNVKSAENLTFYLIPDGKGDDHEDVFKITMNSQLGDSNPEKIKHVGEHTLKVKDDNGNELLNKTGFSLKFGASYEFLIQGEDTGVIKVEFFCKVLD